MTFQCFEIIARHIATKVLKAFAVFVIIGIPLVLLVARTHGLGNPIRRRVEKALSGQFYNVKIHRLLFSISDGLIAENLRVEENTAVHRLLVHANRVTILPKLSSLTTGSVEIDAFQLRHASIDVPLGKTEEPRLRLDYVEAKVVCPPEQLILSNASFDLCGIQVRVSGNFLNPKTFAPHPLPSNGPGQIAKTIELVQQELQRIQWEGAPPNLKVEASGDLTHLESLRADHISFTSGAFNYGPWHLKGVAADLDYANFLLKLQHLSAEDRFGELHVSGKAQFQDKEASLNFSGTSDLAGLLGNFFPKSILADCEWIDPPHLEGSVGVSWKNDTPVLQSEAHLDAARFTCRGVMFDSLSGGCIFQNGRFLARDISIAGDPGNLTVDFMAAPDDYRVRVSASLLPQFLAPMATGKLQEAFSLMNFQDPLKLSFEGRTSKPDLLLLEGSGTLALGHSRMRDSTIDALEATLQMKAGNIHFQNILAKVGEKKAQGECIYDINNQEMRFPSIVSNLDPVGVMMWIDPRIAESLKDYRFKENPNLIVTGCIGLKDPQRNDFKIEIKAPHGVDYTLIKRNLFFNKLAGTASIKKQELSVDIPQAILFTGNVALHARVSIAPSDPRYGAKVHLENVDFKSLTKLYFDYDTSEGKLSGDYHFKTMTGDDYAMTGVGNMVIKDGDVLAMPIFGPLSLLMNDVIPGLGYQSARRATADFTVKNGIINTKNLSIQSIAFSMIGDGDIYYLEDRMNMNVRLNVKGLPGLVLFPVSKLFEYISDGSAKHPTWRSKYVVLPKLQGGGN